MPVSFASPDLVIPRGIVYLAPHPNLSPSVPANGFRDLGNCPGVTLSSSSETQEHRSSRGGIRLVDDKTVMELTRGGNLRCDSINLETLAMYFFSEPTTETQVAVTGSSETLEGVKQGLGYQLGVNATTRPQGYRKVTVTSVVPAGGGTAFVAGTDYEVDSERGFLTIISGGAIADDADIDVTYNVTANSRQIVAAGDTERAFSMQFHAYNPKGARNDYWLPFVRMRPSGDLSLVSDQDGYQEAEFEMEALPLGALAAVYLNGQPVV